MWALMGSHPSADLLYGIDLGIQDEEDYDWLTEELEEEHGGPTEVLDHLLKGSGVGHDMYGNFYSGYTGVALCTRLVHATAYDPEEVKPENLTGTSKDDQKLKAAWSLLHPGQDPPQPSWFIVVSYG